MVFRWLGLGNMWLECLENMRGNVASRRKGKERKGKDVCTLGCCMDGWDAYIWLFGRLSKRVND